MQRSITLAVLCATGVLGIARTPQMIAQEKPTEPTRPAADSAKPLAHDREFYERWQTSSVDRTYKLKYAASAQDANELLAAMRNMLEPQTKIFLVPSTELIAVHAPEEEQARVAKLLSVLDQPHQRYRLTYTFTELDGVRKVGVQHFGLVTNSRGEKMTLKQGSRIPIQIGNSGNSLSSAQITYIDVGMNFEVNLTEIQGGAILRNKIEQTSAAPDSVSPSNPNPIIRQTYLEGTVTLLLGKPLVLGSIDVPGSTHHSEVEVVMEPVN